ncbi:hypothetical protein CPB83DRAFT_366694 [Crepidotus variabilis]|uniref:Uncharacterized protein n=1 Tax=Crepidotus variabilis TaxID=179855 RepID=A0A9P6EFR0_9AGAR|nr:hypothetical protein CPB83DRAFT_366694 [Crepidotus variabilis]
MPLGSAQEAQVWLHKSPHRMMGHVSTLQKTSLLCTSIALNPPIRLYSVRIQGYGGILLPLLGSLFHFFSLSLPLRINPSSSDTNFQGVIPGGQSFAISRSDISQVQGQGTGFNWKPSLRAGTTLLLVGGDGRGNGTAGSSLFSVGAGIAPDQSCLDANSPSSTPGQPAGGSYPTDKSGSGTGGGDGGGSSKSNTGAIIGGVIGGILVFILALLAFWFWKRKQKKARRVKERPDLLNADDDDDEDERRRRGARPNELPQYYQPEPFLVPDPTVGGRSSHDGTVSATNDERRPLSAGTFGDSFYTRATTPDGLGGTAAGSQHGDHYSAGASSANGGRRKGGAPRPMRPVNIIQHDDAGPSGAPPPAEETETIELPPAYTALNKSAVGGEGGAAETEAGRAGKAGRGGEERLGGSSAAAAAPGGSSSGAGGSSSAAV